MGPGDPESSAPPRPEGDTLEREVFEARLEARLLGGAPELPRVDRFVIERLLGAGGMGTVWLARDEALGRHVALKRVRGAAAGRRMRLREARGLARIAHPNVIAIYDVGEADGRVWLAMEYVPGRTLRRAGELDRDALFGHWIAAGRGLAAIHAAGLVHRDVKPDNLLLGDDGRVRVIDLGLVRSVAELDAADARASEVVVTRGFVGTREYAAPEQLRDEAIDARADQYAFCVAMEESLRAAQSTDGGPLPAALLEVLARGREADRSRRFPDMAGLLAALTSAAAGRRRDERAPRSPALATTLTRGSQPRAPGEATPSDSTREGTPAPARGRDEETSPTWIGHYEVLDELGRGGMGIVYAARDSRLDRTVAIKRLLGGRSAHRRLYREALAMAKLSHPNVIPIYEIVEAIDATSIVMEYVEGQTLRAWQATPRPPAEVLKVYKAAARGLLAAHDKHLVHRDFKPDNVMLGDDGRVRVMDFGLASVDASERPESAGERRWTGAGADLELTQPGTLLGTPAYMSPEQLRSAPASAASDLFSFCVALHEALHGERPFAGRSLEELRASVTRGALREAPPGSGVPAWLDAVIRRGLALRPEDRFASMQALLDAIVEGELAANASPREPPAYVFIAHEDRDKVAVLRLCERLIDHGVRPWLDLWERTPGVDVAAAATAALLAAPAVIVCGGDPTAGALAARLARDPATVVGARLPGADAAPLAARAPIVALDEGRWDDGVLELARRVGADPRRERWLADEAARAGVRPEALSPYRGLEAFREQDARWMFGRDDEVAALLELLRSGASRFLTLIGASGSGKSSLLMGGVCPMLRGGALGDGQAWSIGALRPGPRPCEALARALVRLDAGDAEPAAIERLQAELAAERDTLRRRLAQRAGGRTLLVIDQLEELFTEAGLAAERDGDEALAFVRNLVEATRGFGGRSGEVWIAATLRADFVQRALEVPELAEALQVGTYFALPPMREAQIRAAIERPAARVGYRVEAAVVDRLVAAAAHQAGRLPLLQHVLRELWARRDEARRTLTAAAYAETGGLEGAIAVAAERALDGLRARLGAEGESAARRLMTRLVHLGDRRSEDTRRRVTLASLGDDPATRRVLEALVGEARVLVATEVEGQQTVEIAHEALLREWSTLARWLDADRGALQLRQELAHDAARGRGGEFLWGRGRLEEAARVLTASTVELDADERSFLAASERAVRRRQRWVQGGVAALLAAAALVVAVVTEQKAEAERERQQAVLARERAEAALLAAEAAEGAARSARTQAEGDRTQARKSQKENERSVRQMFEVAVRPLTERLIAERQAVGVVEVDERWTPLLARDARTLAAASLGESFRLVVAGHDAVLGADVDGRPIFLEITARWLLADQPRRRVAIVTTMAAGDRRYAALQRALLLLAHEVARLPSLADPGALADVGMVILDGRAPPALGADEVAALADFVARGGGVLAVGRGRDWLGASALDPPSVADYPLNAALAAFGARWSADEVGPESLAKREIAAVVRFENTLPDPVDLFTEGAGREEYYTTLAGGEPRELATAVGRAWIFKTNADGRALGRVEVTAGAQTVSIPAKGERPRPRPRPTSSTPASAPAPAPAEPDAREPAQPQRVALADADLQAGLAEARRSARACGRTAVTPQVTVDLTIGGDGKVRAVAVRPPASGTPVAGCLKTELGKLLFPRSRDGGAVTWTLPLY